MEFHNDCQESSSAFEKLVFQPYVSGMTVLANTISDHVGNIFPTYTVGIVLQRLLNCSLPNW